MQTPAARPHLPGDGASLTRNSKTLRTCCDRDIARNRFTDSQFASGLQLYLLRHCTSSDRHRDDHRGHMFSSASDLSSRLGPSQPGELGGGAKARHRRLASRTLTASQGNARSTSQCDA